MTVENVTQVLNKIEGHKLWVIGRLGFHIPRPLLKEIQMRYSTDADQIHACADYFVNCHPKAEWKYLTHGLYVFQQFAALKEKKSLIPTGKVVTIIVFIV